MKRLYGYPTIVACGLFVGVMWGSLAGEVPASAWTLPSTGEAVEGFKRIRDSMPTPETFLGVREVFKKISEKIK